VPFELPALNETQQRIVDSLRAEGIAVLRYEELLGDPSLDELEADIAPFVRESEEKARDARTIPKNKGDFILRRFVDKEEGASKPRLSLDSPWLRVATSREVLDTINAYRGEATLLHNVDNWYTIPHSAAEKRIASQRWHRDPEEEHVVKVFVYLNDVDSEAGPFEYVSGSPTGQRYGDFWPWNVKKRHPPEEELYAAIAPEDKLTLTGPPGTMFFCDTGGFHRGGFARTKPRVLATWSFVSPASGKTHRFEVDLDRPAAGQAHPLGPPLVC
jgi:ectoine hydroxylase-related dioxygenase (phytanoyl-CoA dioxygenase family)